MTKLRTILLGSLFAFGCGDSVGDLKKEACACKDKACAERVGKKLEKLSESDVKGNEKEFIEISMCLAKAAGLGDMMKELDDK
jgi:hypothetical protein